MTRRIIALILAVFLAMVGTTAVFAYVRGADSRALAGQEPVSAYVASEKVSAGTTLRKAVDDGLIVKELVARKIVPQGALTAVDEGNETLVATTDIAVGEIIFASRFGEQRAASSALALPDGRMAVTVKLEDPQRVAPFLRAGNEVAVFTSFKLRRERSKDDPPANGDECAAPEVCATRIVLPRVTVLGVGAASVQSTTPDDEATDDDTAEPNANETVALITLALTQKEAEKVIHLSFFGNMHFALLDEHSRTKSTRGTSDLDFFVEK